jgi:hypothetical protein
MTEESKGLRSLPPALLLAFAIWIVMFVVRAIFLITAKEPWGAIRFNLTNQGTGFACEVLGLLGSFELARRVSGQAARGLGIVVWGFCGQIVFDVAYSLLGFMDKFWEHENLLKALDYAYWASWLAVPVGVCVACWREKRELGIFIVVVSLLTWPPAFLAKAMFDWLPSGNTGYVLDTAFRAIRFGFLLAGFAAIARSTAVSDRAVAASGLRLSAKSLWLRLIAAAAVPLITLLVIAGKGTPGRVEVLKLATISALVINLIAYSQFGVGALRTARGAVTELGRWPFVLGGAASLWVTGVLIGQLAPMYKLLYKNGEDTFGGSGLEYAQALSLAMPLAITAGTALIAVAIAGLAARRGNDELRAHAQAKGAGFVTLSLVGMAIMTWMLPKASTLSSLAMLMLLALGAMIVAIVMIAKLLGLAADELDREAGMPTATVVH